MPKNFGLDLPDLDWLDQAACVGVSPSIFFPGEVGNSSIKEAQAICNRCPVRLVCLNYALDKRISHGVWGGLSERERRRILRRRNARGSTQ